jgi:hypothetical protein
MGWLAGHGLSDRVLISRHNSWVKRGFLCLLVATLAEAASGCAGNPKLDPTSEPVASQRKAVVDSMLAGAQAASGQFGAGTPLGVRMDTRCEAGTDNWKIHNPYRSQCFVEVVTAYSLDIPPLPAVSDLDARLKAERWSPGERTLTGELGPVESLEARNQLARRLYDPAGLGYDGADGAALRVRLQTAVTAVATPDPTVTAIPGGIYFGSTEGTNWQEAWVKERTHHPNLLVVTGWATFSKQPW